MTVKVTIGTTYCGCPSETIEIECDSIEDFETNHEYSTEILNALSNSEFSHYFIEYDYGDEEDEYFIEYDCDEDEG